MKGKKAILKKKTSNGARGSTSSLILVFKFFSNLWKLAKIYNIKVSLKLFSSYFIKTNNNCEVYEIWSCIRSLHDHGAKEWLFSRQMFGFVKSSLFMGNPCTHTWISWLTEYQNILRSFKLFICVINIVVSLK